MPRAGTGVGTPYQSDVEQAAPQRKRGLHQTIIHDYNKDYFTWKERLVPPDRYWGTHGGIRYQQESGKNVGTNKPGETN